MPYPDCWPDDSQFRPLHWFLEGFNSTAIKEREAVASLADLSGIEAFLTDKYQSKKEYKVAELTDSEMWTKIAVQISHTPRHTAGYKQDKYLPARGLKGTPAGPGQTDLKNFQELFDWDFKGFTAQKVQRDRFNWESLFGAKRKAPQWIQTIKGTSFAFLEA